MVVWAACCSCKQKKDFYGTFATKVLLFKICADSKKNRSVAQYYSRWLQATPFFLEIGIFFCATIIIHSAAKCNSHFAKITEK